MSPFEILRRGRALSDAHFDALYPEWVRELSETFWTPVQVAQRAAHFLAPESHCRVLDVGSGVGKFCLIGAACTGALFHGIEQRAELVAVATQLVEDGHAASFEHGNMLDLDWSAFQGIYLYNPFLEHTSGPWCQIDNSVRYSRATQQHYVQSALEKLEALPAGARVATYYGFGAKLSAAFRKVAHEQYDKGPLELWLKEP